MASRLDTLGRKIVDARKDYEAARKAKTKAEERKNSLESQLAAELEAQNMPSTTLDLGPGYGKKGFARASTIRSRIIDKDAAVRAFEREGLSDGYTVVELRKAPLNELVRSRLENGQPLPDGVDYSETKFVKVTNKK